MVFNPGTLPNKFISNSDIQSVENKYFIFDWLVSVIIDAVSQVTIVYRDLDSKSEDVDVVYKSIVSKKESRIIDAIILIMM